MKETANEHGWLELLKKWLSGDATHTDEADMETRAHSDEFLAEAIEGYREFPDDDHQWHLDKLRGRLFQNKKKRRPVFVYLPRIAAAAAVLVVAWWLLAPLLKSEGEALTEAAKTSTPNVEVPENQQAVEHYLTDSATQQNEGLADEEALPEAAPPPASAGAVEQTPTPPNAQPEQARIAAVENQLKTNARPSPSMEVLPPPAARVKEQVDTTLTSLNSGEMTALDAPATYSISGKVLDAQSGDPLIGASIQVLGSSAGAITDVNGVFQLPLPESRTKLQVSYTGYETQQVEVSVGSPVNVALHPASSALSEVVVTGRKAVQKKDVATALTTTEADQASPKGGWKKWERYLRRKLQYPDEARSKGVEGEVVLQFVVAPDGRPTRITVVKSLSSACDAEAVRLLQNGPKWDPPGPASVSIRFQK